MWFDRPTQLSSKQTPFSSNFFDYDEETDFTFYPPEHFFSDTPTPTLASTPVLPKRCSSGKGTDSQRTSQFRAYDISQSPALAWLKWSYDKVTRDVLRRLIDTVMMQTPIRERPDPPGRNMKRVKSGLVIWLDQHIELVIRYLYTSKWDKQSRMSYDVWKRIHSSRT
jgi:hypothetical protein